MKRILTIALLVFSIAAPAAAQDGEPIDLVQAMQQIDALRQDVETQQTNAAEQVRAANASLAVLQAQVAAQISASQAVQSQALLAIAQAQQAQAALNQAQYNTALALSSQSIETALQTMRDTTGLMRDQIQQGAEVKASRDSAGRALADYQRSFEAYVLATERYEALQRDHLAATRSDLDDANSRIERYESRLTELADQSGTTQAWLLLSSVLNLALVVALIVVVIRFRPVIIERLRHEPDPIVVDNDLPEGPIVLPPLDDDERVFDLLRGQIG